MLYAVSHDLRHDVSSRAIDAIVNDCGVRFDLAFAQAPYCAPSRNSFFTGRRPTVTGVHTFDAHDARSYAPIMRQRTHGPHSPLAARPPWTALPQAFADAGYSTYGAGITIESFRDSAARCPGCWTDGYYLDWPPNPDLATFDSTVARAGSAWLRRWHNNSSRNRSSRHGDGAIRSDGDDGSDEHGRVPFFLMVGFHGGHKPWPMEPSTHGAYGTDGYTLRGSDLAMWRKPYATGDLTSLEQTASEFRGNWLAGSGERTVEGFELSRRGYLVNAQRFDVALGELIETAKSLAGEWARTVVVFHGDHGLSLGEYGVAGKGKLLDVDSRVPFVLRVPGLLPPGGVGSVGREVVELVDVYPTLCDLASIPCPPRGRLTLIGGDMAAGRSGDGGGGGGGGGGSGGDERDERDERGGRGGRAVVQIESAPPLDGRSLVRLLLPPSLSGANTVATEDDDGTAAVAISTYPRCEPTVERPTLSCNGLRAVNISIMGTSVRSRTWRLVVWTGWDAPSRRPIFRGLDAHIASGDVELYRFEPWTSDAGGNEPERSQRGEKDLAAETVNLAATLMAAADAMSSHSNGMYQRGAHGDAERDAEAEAAELKLAAQAAASVDPKISLRGICEQLYVRAVAAWPGVPPPPAPPPPDPPPLPPSSPTCIDSGARLAWCAAHVRDSKCNVTYVLSRCKRSCGLCGVDGVRANRDEKQEGEDDAFTREGAALEGASAPETAAHTEEVLGHSNSLAPAKANGSSVLSPVLPSAPSALRVPSPPNSQLSLLREEALPRAIAGAQGSSQGMGMTAPEATSAEVSLGAIEEPALHRVHHAHKAESFAAIGGLLCVVALCAFCCWGRVEAQKSTSVHGERSHGNRQLLHHEPRAPISRRGDGGVLLPAQEQESVVSPGGRVVSF